MSASIESFGQRLLDTDGMELVIEGTAYTNDGYIRLNYTGQADVLSILEKLSLYRQFYLILNIGSIDPNATSTQNANCRNSLYRCERETMRNFYKLIRNWFATQPSRSAYYTLWALGHATGNSSFQVGYSSSELTISIGPTGIPSGTPYKIYGIK